MSDGNLLQGQQYDQAKDIVIRYSEQMRDVPSAATALGDPRTEITPNDYNSSKVRIYQDPTGLDSLVISGPATTSLNLPDVLNSITVFYNQNTGTGDYQEDNISNSQGDHLDLTVALSGNAQSSCAIIPELVIDISQTWAHGIPSTRYFFYMTAPVTRATILARLAAIIGSPVLDLPVFKPKPHTLLLKGQSLAVRVEAKVRQYVYGSPTYTASSLDDGRGVSYDMGLSVRSVQIPPTIHPLITLAATSQNVQVTARALANIVGGLNFPAHAVLVSLTTPLLTATVTPTTLAATSPASIPTSGLYLVDSSFESDREWGRTKVFAEVVDFSLFA